MTPAAILKQSAADGVILSLSASGTIKAAGDQKQVDKWVPVIREHKINIIAALAEAANDDTDPAENVACFAWLIHFADRNPVKVTFSPMATHAAALACYPDALAAEPIPGTPSRTPTAEESAHLAVLLAAIYGDDSEDDRTEALQAALADPDNALTCYTAIASERGPILPDNDDRRTCRQCANLRGGVCVVACPGGAVSANRGYRPVADLLQRCEAFTNRASLPIFPKE